jgi:plasmid stability protein
MFKKISIRNIPSQIFQALETLAYRHDRSTEAEARQALRAWVEPLSVQDSRNSRSKAVAARLNLMLSQVNAGQQGRDLAPSHIAEAIKEERAGEVEDWFLGEKEPSFAQLEAIASFLGVNSEWLKHGDKTLYPPEYHRLSENPFEAVDWLLTWNDTTDASSDGTVKTLHLIRADNDTGGLYIVKESDQGHFRTFYTPIHVSEAIGAGGEASLAALFVTLEILYKRYTKMGSDIMVLGYQLRPNDITQLTGGNTHPGVLLKEASRSMWWEDLWDRKMAPHHNYFPGWQSLYERIDRVISGKASLNKIRTQIRQGETATMPQEEVQHV